LAITVRSSCPLKNWLILANSTGIIDADYCDNPDNEGEIFFQLINLSPFDIQLRAGDRIGQGIIMPYIKTCDDVADGVRVGGLGSTDAQEIEGQKSLFEDYCECVFACNPERRAYVFGVDLSNG
jgi:dUTPase